MAQGSHQPSLVIQLANHLQATVGPETVLLKLREPRLCERLRGHRLPAATPQAMTVLLLAPQPPTLRDASSASSASRSLFTTVELSRILMATVVSCQLPM